MDFCKCEDGYVPEIPLVPAMATVPVQDWEQIYDLEKALKQGTVFPSLDLPFYVTGGELHA